MEVPTDSATDQLCPHPPIERLLFWLDNPKTLTCNCEYGLAVCGIEADHGWVCDVVALGIPPGVDWRVMAYAAW